MEAVACQRILALQDLDPTHFGHDNDRAPHSAVRAGAAADRIETVAERHLETHRGAMALASPNVRVSNHIARVSCSDPVDAQSSWGGREHPGTSTGPRLISVRRICEIRTGQSIKTRASCEKTSRKGSMRILTVLRVKEVVSRWRVWRAGPRCGARDTGPAGRCVCYTCSQ